MSTRMVGWRVPMSTRSASMPAAGNRIGEEGEFVALGVRRADHIDAPSIAAYSRTARERPLHFFETRVSY